MNLILKIFPVLELASSLSVGVLAGALLTEANVLVPYWRKMNPKDFLALHHQLGPSLFRFFAPFTIAGTMLPVVTLSAAYLVGAVALFWWLIAATIGLTMLGLYFAYFKGANESFAAGAIKEQDLAAELARWAFWHQVRTILAVASALVTLLAISS